VTGIAERRSTTEQRLVLEASKRVVDLALSAPLIILATPLLLLLALLVRLTSPGPALFRQERLGRDRQPFTLLKLRTMYIDGDDQIHRDYVTSQLAAGSAGSAGPAHPDAPAGGSGLFKLDGDPRVTPFGAWLRRTSLDELPQLVNVFRGEMSLVGPRPVLPWEAQLFGATHDQRFAVKPGITGLWQVSGRSRLSMRQALDLDVEYVVRRGFLFDLGILLRTLPALFRGGAL
jgi:lipopolysaccharide/colanic/teichoic acid biosynthesis glycosyltransferase